ncbi:MAG: alpha/beta hydrolase, partial [Clostridia bacterium]|nr:alpha/beta hydrolase [Clostridia bacterium]
RKYTAKYGYLLDGVVYTGTSGENPMLGIGLHLANTLIKQNRPQYRSDILNTMAFGAYNRKTKKRTECDWVSRDEAEVDKFIADDLCGYQYTVSGMKALFMTLKQVSSRRWYNTIPLSMPIYLLSGSMDPVGDYGKGVKEVYKKLKKTGHKNVTMKIYEDARHEIFNEINRDEVHLDIITWLDERTEKHKEEMQKSMIVESIDEPVLSTEITE